MMPIARLSLCIAGITIALALQFSYVRADFSGLFWKTHWKHQPASFHFWRDSWLLNDQNALQGTARANNGGITPQRFVNDADFRTSLILSHSSVLIVGFMRCAGPEPTGPASCLTVQLSG